MLNSVISISIGATLGALLRWFLGMQLNNLFPTIPLGTLAANLIGAYIIGFAIGYFAQAPEIPPEWRLLIITGFCGGLTTFSTFSAEIVTLLQENKLYWALSAITVHVSGSLLMTLIGLFTWQSLKLR